MCSSEQTGVVTVHEQIFWYVQVRCLQLSILQLNNRRTTPSLLCLTCFCFLSFHNLCVSMHFAYRLVRCCSRMKICATLAFFNAFTLNPKMPNRFLRKTSTSVRVCAYGSGNRLKMISTTAMAAYMYVCSCSFHRSL